MVLQVYGVRDVERRIGRDLVALVAKVLDEAALEVLSGELKRNASLRLSATDIAFLRQPAPDEVRLTVPPGLDSALPSWRALLEQVALLSSCVLLSQPCCYEMIVALRVLASTN